MIKFTVFGEPKAKARPRVTRSGFAYTPKDTVMYENLVRTSLTEQCGLITPMEGEVIATIIAYFKIAKSAPKKRREQMAAGLLNPTKKPDLDNIAKAILDSINGIAYIDDSQVTGLTIIKKYSNRPRVEVVLQEMNNNYITTAKALDEMKTEQMTLI